MGDLRPPKSNHQEPEKPYEPTDAEVERTIVGADRQMYDDRLGPAARRKVIFDFYKRLLIQANKEKREKGSEPVSGREPFNGVFQDIDPSQTSAHATPPGEFDDISPLDESDTSSGTRVIGQTADDKTPPKPTEKELRRERIHQANSRGEFADPDDVAEEEAEERADAERYKRKLAEARERKAKEFESEFPSNPEPESPPESQPEIGESEGIMAQPSAPPPGSEPMSEEEWQEFLKELPPKKKGVELSRLIELFENDENLGAPEVAEDQIERLHEQLRELAKPPKLPERFDPMQYTGWADLEKPPFKAGEPMSEDDNLLEETEGYTGRGQYLSGKSGSQWYQKLFKWIAKHPKTSVGSGLAMAGTGLGTELSSAPRLAGVFYAISWIIWVVVIYFSGLWKKSRPLSIALMGGLALGLFGFWRALLPERQPTPEEYAEAVWRKAPGNVPGNVAATPAPVLTDPSFPDDLKSVVIAMGVYEVSCDVSDLEHGVPLPRALPSGKPLPQVFLDEKPLPVFLKVRNGKLYTSVELTNLSCEPEMILKDNQITLNSSDWDRNMNRDALEVVDDAQRPVFQIIYERPTRLRIHGTFCSQRGIVFTHRTGLGVGEYGYHVPNELAKIFRYPSSKHPGETVRIIPR